MFLSEETGYIVDLFDRKIFPGKITIKDKRIASIESSSKVKNQFILPGFIDSHLHIESTMLVPSRFSELIVSRGTIGVVADPHEIANVLGVEGVKFMIEDGKKVPFHFFFGVPSCVPATKFETSGANINSDIVESLFKNNECWFLAEMMNFPGVVNNDPEVMKLLEVAKKYNKKIDGHAPGLRGQALKKYINAGISTDHESLSLEEAEEKILNGMKIQIREGSAGRNFEQLYPLFNKYADQLMLCTDDIHPDDLLLKGHIDHLVKMGLKKGIDLMDLLRSASLIPIQHYALPIGLLQVNDAADFIVVKDLKQFEVIQTVIKGESVYHYKRGLSYKTPSVKTVNKFRTTHINKDDLKVFLPKNKKFVKAIEIIDGDLMTKLFLWEAKINEDREISASPQNDVLKLVVVNRYHDAKASVAFVKNFGISLGAVGSTVAHDSHNIIVAGCDDDAIYRVVEKLIENKGGIAVDNNVETKILPLEIAGLMSTKKGEDIAEEYKKMNELVRNMGSKLHAPFMALSFLALLVIPELKLSDKGLFDVKHFKFVPLFE